MTISDGDGEAMVVGGAEGIRTPDLLRAREALSQLSYSPIEEAESYYTRLSYSDITSAVSYAGMATPVRC